MNFASNWAYFLGKWILIVTMFTIVCLVLVQVLMRYVFNTGLLWPEEITKWCLVWVGYVGAGVALKDKGHVTLSLFVDRLSQGMRFWALHAGKWVVLLFLIAFTILGVQQALRNPAYSWAVNVRYLWVMLGLPLAGTLMITHIFYFIFEDLLSLFERGNGQTP